MDFIGEGSGVDAMAGIETGSRAGRRDGRADGEMRGLSVTRGILLRADGSARVQIGGTDVLVAVYGPMECSVAKQITERADVHVIYRRRGGLPGTSGMASASGAEATASRDLREIVLQCLLAALYPRKAIALTVHILGDSGGVAAAAVNATTLAMVDAGLPLACVPTSVCVSIHNGALVVDPTCVEENEAQAVLTFAFNAAKPLDEGFISVNSDGDCGGEKLFTSAACTAYELAAKAYTFVKLSIDNKGKQKCAWQ